MKMCHSVISLVLFLFISAAANAQQIEFSSSLNPVGSGARATGMGGAFIGVADDATAASWNPAGLVQLERPEASLVYGYFSRNNTYSSTTHPEMDGDTAGKSGNELNYGSAAYPFTALDRNMIFSLNYQRLYEMNKKAHIKYTWDLGSSDKEYDTIDFNQNGYLYALSPAYAVQIMPQLYFGVTLNLWGNYLGGNGWNNTYISSGYGAFAGNSLIDNVNWNQDIKFRGFNANIGLMWKINGQFTLGAVYKTPFSGRLKDKQTFQELQTLGGTTNTSSATTKEYMTMNMPASYGLGFNYHPTDHWVFDLDVYRTEWSTFYLDDQGNKINPLSTEPLSNGRLNNTTQVRLGGEYLFISEKLVIPVRMGLFYDPEPATGKLDNYYGIAVGSGYSTGKVSFDLSYQFRFGRKVVADVASITGSSINVDQHTVMLSLIYYF
ncbi:MAG: outer membrane protein transport protein [Nitrospirae bacterium]|nr:outer membrane protein transport protein [Nitrospirota bacterium]